MASSNNVTKNNTANNYAAVSRYATAASSSGWGPLPTTLSSSNANTSSLASATTGATKTLAEYLKESAAYSNSLTQQQRSQQQSASGTALPWAAAIKAAEQQHLQNASNQLVPAVAASAYDTRNNTIGSWNSPETSSSSRGGLNSDGSMKSDGAPDDGTAIWGNPSTKKTGIDWTEKESLSNPPQATGGSSEKRVQKLEPAVSSLNGTEAWGTPTVASNSLTLSAANSQQQSKLNDNSGNNYGTKTTTINNEPLGWGESSSLQGNNESSSPPNNSIWNILANNGKHKPSTDWLSSASSTASSSIVAAVTNSRVDDISKQLEATSLFDAISSSSSLAKNSSSLSLSAGNNRNFDNQSSAINSSANNVIGAGTIGGGLSGGNSINDLKQMSANFSNGLLDSSSRPPGGNLASSNNPQSQLNTYSLGMTPSRELLKQMVHQIHVAVQAGHLNAQILNQPMSNPTLQLVLTLLQQLKLLKEFQDIQDGTVSKSNDVNSANLDLQINRVQQNISLLQKAITQQQAALTKNESLVDTNPEQQKPANNYSYANISKLSTNMKVPPSNMSNLSSNNSIDSFKRSSLIDTLPSNSNSDSQRSAQATIDSNSSIDKTLSPLLQSSVNNILNNRAQSFASGHSASQQQQQQQQQQHQRQQQQQLQQQQQQAQKSGLLSAQTSLSSSNAAWGAFNSSDLVSSGWPRISSNVSQQDQQFNNSDLISEFVNSRGWRGSSLMGPDGKEIRPPTSLAPGANANLARPNSASNNLKQMSETNDILNSTSGSSFSPSAIGGLSLQSNPWLYPPTSSSLNFASGIDNLIGNSSLNGANHGGKLDNGNTDKMGGDSLNFLRSTSSANDMQRSSSALYDWGNIGSSNLQFNADPSSIGGKQTSTLSNCGGAQTSANSQGARPAPPPGILCGFGSMMGNSSNSMNENPNSDSSKLRKSIGENQVQSSRDSAASLWGSTWFD